MMIKVTKLVSKPYKKKQAKDKESKDYRQYKRNHLKSYQGGLSNKTKAEYTAIHGETQCQTF